MSREQYKVWSPEMSEAEDDCRLFKAYGAEEAAKQYAEKSYWDEAFHCEMTIYVRGPHGEFSAFGITPEETVHFYASDLDVEDPAEATQYQPEIPITPEDDFIRRGFEA